MIISLIDWSNVVSVAPSGTMRFSAKMKIAVGIRKGIERYQLQNLDHRPVMPFGFSSCSVYNDIPEYNVVTARAKKQKGLERKSYYQFFTHLNQPLDSMSPPPPTPETIITISIIMNRTTLKNSLPYRPWSSFFLFIDFIFSVEVLGEDFRNGSHPPITIIEAIIVNSNIKGAIISSIPKYKQFVTNVIKSVLRVNKRCLYFIFRHRIIKLLKLKTTKLKTTNILIEYSPISDVSSSNASAPFVGRKSSYRGFLLGE